MNEATIQLSQKHPAHVSLAVCGEDESWDYWTDGFGEHFELWRDGDNTIVSVDEMEKSRPELLKVLRERASAISLILASPTELYF